MKYKCEVCHDTGNKDKDIGGIYLNCIACSAATDRVTLEAFVDKLPAMGEQEQAWRIHQRAIAMAAAAPQVVADERAAFVAWFAENGAPYPGVSLAQDAFVAGYRAALAAAPVQAQEPYAWECAGTLVKTKATRESFERDGFVPVALFTAPVQPVAVPDDLDMQTIRERDFNAEMADKLADGIAEHFGADIGEHSSANCPWVQALDLLNTKPEFINCAGSKDAAPAAQGDALNAKRYEFLRAIGAKQQNIIAHYALEEMDKVVDAAIAAKAAS